MNPLISIVIPFYDHTPYLPQAVESALAQTYANTQVIVVDDASPVADARELLNEQIAQHGDKLTVIRRETNGGSAAAKNTGIAASKGEFIVPLDSDDVLDSRYVEIVFAAYSQERFVGNSEANSTTSKLSGVFTQTQVFGFHNFVHTPECTMLAIMSGTPAPTTFLYTREMFNELGGYNTSVYHDDDEFWLRALSNGHTFCRVEKPLYHYRKHGRGKSDSNRAAALSSFAKEHPALYEKHLPEVLESMENKYFKSVDEYQTLHDAFKELSAYHEDLEKRFAALAEQNVQLNKKLSLRVFDKVKSALKGPTVNR